MRPRGVRGAQRVARRGWTLAARFVPALLAASSLIGVTGCATFRHRHAPPGVPIEQRPTPPQPPDTAATVPAEPVPADASATSSGVGKAAPQTSTPAPPPPVETAMSPEERAATLARIVADTTSASAAVKKCAGKDLLPDQESVFETARSMLLQARAAIAHEELWRAESLARKARQLALSLDCH
jgi:hypothetical protein